MRTDPISRRAAGFWLFAICALGLAVRLYGLAYSLPDVQHPDEIPILNRALALANNHFNPGNFLYPTLYFYALFIWEGLFFVAGRLTGLYGNLAAFERSFFVDPSRIVLAGRALTAVFGVLTLPAVYQLGARMYQRSTGLVAALLLAVAPFAVRDAHYIKLDVPVTLFVVLALGATVRLMADETVAETRRGWVLAGAMAGFALSTQYYAAPVIVPIVAAAALEGRRTGRWGEAFGFLVWAGVASVAAFLVASPFFLSDLQTTIRDMKAVKQIDMDRAVVASGAFSSLSGYLRMIATDAIGWTTALLAPIGFVVAIVLDRRRGLVLLSFALAYLAFLANTTLMSRYLNPLLPTLAVAAAAAITLIRPRVALVLVAAGVAVPGLLGTLRADEFYREADTRTLARQFIERTAPAGSTVVVQPHGVQLRVSKEALIEALRAHLGSESRASLKFQKQLAAANAVAPAYRVLYLGRVTDGGFDPDKIYVAPGDVGGAAGLEPLRALRVAYVAVNRYNNGKLAFESLDAALQREGRLLATFSPYRADIDASRRAAVAPFFHNTADRIDPALERPGPVVEVWRIE